MSQIADMNTRSYPVPAGQVARSNGDTVRYTRCINMALRDGKHRGEIQDLRP